MMPAPELLLVVAVALRDEEGRILIARRAAGHSMAGLWEFPGGKIDAGETPEAALIRELREELDISVQVQDLVPLSFASHGYAQFHLLMPLYLCDRWRGQTRPLIHDRLCWVAPENLADYPMPEADLPLIPVLQGLES